VSSSVSVRLDAHNFMLWRGLTVPALAGAGLLGHLDGTAAPRQRPSRRAPVMPPWTSPTRSTPASGSWARGSSASSLAPWSPSSPASLLDVRRPWTYGPSCTGCTACRVAPRFIMFVANSSPFARGDARCPVYAVDEGPQRCHGGGRFSPHNDELVKYIITGLGKEFNAITTTLTLGNNSVPYDEFYSRILSIEALQEQQDQLQTAPPRRMPSRAPATTPTLAGRALPSTRLLLLASWPWQQRQWLPVWWPGQRHPLWWSTHQWPTRWSPELWRQRRWWPLEQPPPPMPPVSNL
jgi:hypothetical protein